MPPKKSKTDLVKSHVAIARFQTVEEIMVVLSDYLSLDLSPPQLSEVHIKLDDWFKNLKDLKENTRQRLLDLLIKDGKKVTDKGSKELEVDGYVLRCKPTKTGISAQKLEALIRAKNLDVDKVMQPVVTYELDEAKLAVAISKKLLTADEAATCVYDPSYALDKPKKVTP